MSARRVVLGLLFALAEGCLVAPVLVLLPTSLQSLSHPMILGLTWLVLSAIMGTYRTLAARDASLSTQRVILALWLAGLLCAFTLLSEGSTLTIARQGIGALAPLTIVTHFTAAVLLWWRGTALGRVELMPAEAQQRLRNGLVLFSGYTIITLLSPTYDLLAFLVPFLCGALLALPLSYLERVEQTDVGQHVAMTWRWWRSILVSVGLAMLASVGVMAVFTPDIVNQALILLAALIVVPLTLILGLLLEVLINLIRPLLNHPVENPIPAAGLDALRQLQQRPEPTSSPLVISDQVIFIAVIVVLFTIMLLMLLTTARARRQPIRVRRGVSEDEPAEPDASAARGEPNALSRALDLRRWLAGVSIRRLYARMLHEAAKRGFPRLPAQTPYDYIPQLVSAFPGASAEVRLVTDAYVAAHYGQVPDTDEELAEIRAAWERARAVPHKRTDETKEGA